MSTSSPTEYFDLALKRCLRGKTLELNCCPAAWYSMIGVQAHAPPSGLELITPSTRMMVPRQWTQAVDVEAPQEWRKRHKHDCAKTNKVTHGIIDKNVDLEALALEYRFLDRGSTLPVLRPTTAAGSGVLSRCVIRARTTLMHVFDCTLERLANGFQRA